MVLRGGYVEWDIGYATSVNGSTWTKYANNPVLLNGPAGTWDANFTAFSPVIDSAGVKYKMWYIGGSDINSSAIGYAESSPYVEIPDTAFLRALIEEGVDTNGDGLISYTEAEAIISLDVSGGGFDVGYIKDMAGVEAFVNLDSLRCGYNQFTSIDVSGNTLLRYLNIYSYFGKGEELLSVLDLAKNTSLEVLICVGHKLTNLDVKNNLSLEYLDCAGNEITNLDLSKNFALETLICEGNKITSLDLSNNTVLRNIIIGTHWIERFPGTSYPGDSLISLDINNCAELTHLNVRGCSLLSLDVSNNTALTILDCGENQLTNLDLSNNTALTTLNCWENQLTTLDLSNNTELATLDCAINQLTSLEVSSCTALNVLWCNDNPLVSLDVSGCIALTRLEIGNMPTLYEVCVWESFPVGVEVWSQGSPNVCFQTDCNGDCSIVGIENPCPSELSIYPNPTNSLLTIETVTFDHYLINITSLNGQQILTGEMEGTTHQIDLSSFQKGVYFISIRSKDFVTTKKLLKL